MMRFSLLLVFGALMFAPIQGHQAYAANMPGVTGCSPIGKTMLSDDKANIIACTCTVAATLNTACAAANSVWKEMTYSALSGATLTCPAGKVLVGIKADGSADCVYSGIQDRTCPPGKAIVKITNGIPECGDWAW